MIFNQIKYKLQNHIEITANILSSMAEDNKSPYTG